MNCNIKQAFPVQHPFDTFAITLFGWTTEIGIKRKLWEMPDFVASLLLDFLLITSSGRQF